MSEQSRGRLDDQQEFPAESNPSGESHDGALHRASTNRFAALEAMQIDEDEANTVATHDHSPYEAMDIEDGGVALPIRPRNTHDDSAQPAVSSAQRPGVHSPDEELLDGSRPEDEHMLDSEHTGNAPEQRENLSLVHDPNNYDLDDALDDAPIHIESQGEVEEEHEEMATAEHRSDALQSHDTLGEDGPVDPHYPFFQPRNPARPWADDDDTSLPYEATPNVNSYQELATESRDSTSSDSIEFLAWKAKGRPDCPRCLKSHCGECRLTKMESELLEHDPEGYARYRKRMKKPRSRRYQHVANKKSKSYRHPPQQDETTAAQNVSNPEGPLQHDEAPTSHNMSNLERMANSPYALTKTAAFISGCSRGELEDLQRNLDLYLETEPHMAVVARIAADALQRMTVTSASAAESQQSDGLQETDAPQARDETTVEDTSHNNGPSIDFRTGAELAYHRSLERGGPSAKAEGKQPKK